MEYRYDMPRKTGVYALRSLDISKFLIDKDFGFTPTIMHGEIEGDTFYPYNKDGSRRKNGFSAYSYRFFDSYKAAYQVAVRDAVELLRRYRAYFEEAAERVQENFDPDFNSCPEHGEYLIRTRTEEDGSINVCLIGRAHNDPSLHPTRSTIITEFREEWVPAADAVKDGKFVLHLSAAISTKKNGLPAGEASSWYKRKNGKNGAKYVYKFDISLRAKYLTDKNAVKRDGLYLVDPRDI